MKSALQRELEEIEFAMKNIVTVAERRKDFDALAKCYDLLSSLQDFFSNRGDKEITETNTTNLYESLYRAYQIADNLAMATMLEIREVLFPILSIKQQTHRLGEQFFDSYFAWLDYPDQYTPEQLMGFLENDLRKLKLAENL